MGPIDWIAVVAAWFVAALVGMAFYGRKAAPLGNLPAHSLAALLLFVSAAMIGHMLARVGADTLNAKPWLYFMMSGGLALTFIGPAIVITSVRRGQSLISALVDWLAWLTTYLAMGTTFWVLD